jgi:hypothetical protein
MRLLRSMDGNTWQNVPVAGLLQDLPGSEIQSVTVFQDILYLALSTPAGLSIFHSVDGEHWSALARGGFGDPFTNAGTHPAVAAFQGGLYFGARNSAKGAQVWRMAALPEPPPVPTPTPYYLFLPGLHR